MVPTGTHNTKQIVQGFRNGFTTYTNPIDTIQNKDLAVLIPGCGNTYEAEYLLEKVLRMLPLSTSHISGCFANQIW
jgi:hypothetical protein